MQQISHEMAAVSLMMASSRTSSLLLRLRPLRTAALRLPEAACAHVSSLALTVVGSAMIVLAAWLIRSLLLEPLSGMLPSPGAPPLLQPLWRHIVGRYGETVTSPVFPGLLTAVFYFLACLPYALADALAPPVTERFKLQPSAPQRPDAWAHALGLTAWHHVFYIVPGLISQWSKRGPWPYSHDSPVGNGSAAEDGWCMERCDGAALLPDDAPRLDVLLLHLFLCFVLFDAFYFLWHMAHHASPALYKHIHSVHHEYSAPFCWVTQHEHVLELLAVSIWSVLVPISLECHPLTQWVFMLAATQLSVEAHSGYSVGVGRLLKAALPRLWGGAEHHDFHHRLPRRNFQPFFTHLDRAFGTYHDPDAEGRSKSL